MLTNILTHLLAALIPLVGYFAFNQLREYRRFTRFRKEFWARQTPEALARTGFMQLKIVPQPVQALGWTDSARTAVQAISLADELGVYALLAAEPGLPVDEIARRLGLPERHLRAAVEVLRAVDVLQEYDGGLALTPKARVYLMKDSPFALYLPPPVLGRQFLKLVRAGEKKKTSNQWSQGKAEQPEGWAMQQHLYSFPLGFALHRSGLLAGAGSILDVAGGAGSVCAALALTGPDRRIAMIELPGSLPVAEKLLDGYRVSGQVHCLGMDMFRGDWPGEQDAVLFTNIFHDWDEERVCLLAQKAYAALKPGGRVLIQEALLNEDRPGPLWTAHWSMAMAVMMQGRQFRLGELRHVLEPAGFREIQAQPLLGYYSSVVGVKPG